jgi:hypothetical protein
MKNPNSKGIVISGGSDNSASGNTIIGFDVGVHIEGGIRNRADGNFVLSNDAAHIYAQLENAIASSAIQEQIKDQLLTLAQQMKTSTGTPSFIQKYKSFMSVLSDHMQVLGPVVGPILPALSGLLPG